MIVGCKGKLVLVKRAIEPSKDMWSFPGGRVRHRETIEEATNRIAMSELGVRVEIKKMVDYMEFLNEDYQHSLSILFLVNIKDEDIKLDFQSSEVGFFDSLPDNMQPQHKQAYEKYRGL
jgi:ADP-ribose pyrophosphatase YjhB (NUDIX family)